MHVTVEVLGDDCYEIAVDGETTYADLLAEVGLSVHEATAVVDGRPVPEDQRVETDHVQVLRLVAGGSRADGSSERPRFRTVPPARSTRASSPTPVRARPTKG